MHSQELVAFFFKWSTGTPPISCSHFALSGKNLALSLTDEHYDETTQWQHHNAPGDVAPLSLAQKGLKHFMSTELLSTPQSILPPRSAAGAGAGQDGARVAGLSGRAPSGMLHLLRQGKLGAGSQQPRH